MNPAKYPSKERVELDGALVHAEGDDLLEFPEEAARQGYKVDTAKPRIAKERIERDGVLVAAEGDVLPDDEQPASTVEEEAPAAKTPVKKSAAPAKTPANKAAPAAKKS